MMLYAFLIGFFISHTLGYSALSSGTLLSRPFRPELMTFLLQASPPSLSDSQRTPRRWRSEIRLCSSLSVGLTPRSPPAFEEQEQEQPP